jgi:hypothetical protein
LIISFRKMGGKGGYALSDQSRVVKHLAFSAVAFIDYPPVAKLPHDFINSGFAVPEGICHAIQQAG